ncbi:MAG TPA: folate-binding protein [Mycobacteriales bacterium]|nr:folate-binding protein [Mycobacteriales bacterium]
MTSPLLARPGAVAGVGIDAGVAAHYGDPFREQRVMFETGALVDRSHRGVVRISGADRLTWLHSLTSQHLEALPAGEVREALILSPHGHVEHHLVVVDDGTATWLTVEPDTSHSLVGYLDSMRFMLRVEVEDLSASYGVLSEVAGDVVRDDIVTIDELVARVDAGSLPLVGHDAWEAHRVARRVPRLGFETDHRTIPHEVGWIGVAVHLDKGCYRGQETVARVHNLGRPPRRLVFGHLDGTVDELPPAHTAVSLDDRDIGFLGTAVHHAELGPIALAVVKRATPDDAPLSTAGMAMKIERVVDA